MEGCVTRVSNFRQDNADERTSTAGNGVPTIDDLGEETHL